jgi:hypothetical protein
MGQMNRAAAREQQERQQYEQKIKDRFASTLVIGACNVGELIDGIEIMRPAFGAQSQAEPDRGSIAVPALKREDLQLICFDILSGA